MNSMTPESVAVGMIIAEDGRLLLQLRSDRPGTPAAGRWGMFGGHIEPGEAPSAAFLREMQEELGWRPKRFEPWLTRHVRASRGGWTDLTSHVFAAHLDVATEALTLGEGQALRLFAPDALPPDLVPGMDALIAEFVVTDVYERTRRAWHKVFCAGLLVDTDGRFLLQHRDDKPGIINPGAWSTFGGHLEPYETPEEGYVREIEEELAWRPSRSTLAEAHGCACFGPEHLVYDFASPIDIPHERLELHEGQGMGFFAPDALPDGLVAETREEILRFAATPLYAETRQEARRAKA